MAGIPAAARALYLVLAVLLLTCPICSLGSRSVSPQETVVWATIAPAAPSTPVNASPTPASPPAAATATTAPATTATAPSSATASLSPTSTPRQPESDLPTPAEPAADTPTPGIRLTPRRIAPGESGTATATAAAAATAPLAPPREPREAAPELRPDMLSEPGAPVAPSSGANLADMTQLHPLLPLQPELADVGAPAWLREGTRVIYEVMSATLGVGPDQGGGGSAGLMQYDLVALDAGSAVSSVKFLLDAGTGGYSPSLILYSLGVPGSGDYWVHPDALRNAEDLAQDELTVARTPTQIAGKSYNAVRLEYRPEGAEYIWMFDQETGLLLFYRHAIQMRDGTQQSSIMSFLSLRQLEVPWAGARAPEWVQPGADFAYSGSYTPVISGVGPTPLAYAVEFKVRLAQERWWLCDVSQATAGTPGNSSQRLSGASQLADALWIPPEALQAMRAGQVLDRDPTTGIELTVAQAGRDVVVLAETGALHQSRLVYDAREGILLASEMEAYTPLVTTRISLELVRWP